MTDLEEMFDAARKVGPPPSEDLMSRILADAARLQSQRPEPLAPVRSTSPDAAPRSRIWTWAVEVFGGAGALAGALTAGIAGLTLGYVQPTGLTALSALLEPAAAFSQTVELMPGLETLLTEE